MTLCPLKMVVPAMNQYEDVDWQCEKDDCAWFCPADGFCAVAILAMWHRGLAKDTIDRRRARS